MSSAAAAGDATSAGQSNLPCQDSLYIVPFFTVLVALLMVSGLSADGAAELQGQTVTTQKQHTTQADRNYEAFRKVLPDLLKSYPGKFALMHDGEVVDFFSSLGDAVKFGKERFGDNNFSVQEVTSQTASLGFHSYGLYHFSH